MGPMVDVVLPAHLKPLVAEYDDPIRMEDLMWPTTRQNPPTGLTLEQKMRSAHEARKRAALASQLPTN
jgi:hypothetical protein